MCENAKQSDSVPSAVDLKRINPALNMRRFYRMSIQPDLFGGASLVREWGRIGFRGQTLVELHEDEEKAVAALLKLASHKQRRGYTSKDKLIGR